MVRYPASPAAWAVHVLTASGAVLGLLAALATFERDFRAAFLWLALATAIDAVDGLLARALRVRQRLPFLDGGRLDDIVDYITFVFVPGLIVHAGGLVPAPLALPVVSAMLLSSAYGFSRVDAKTSDHFFTGFPSYWNIAALYLHTMGLSPGWNAAILIWLAAMVFVPIGYVYPSRTPTLRVLTNVLASIWAILMIAIVVRLPAVSKPLVWASLLFPAYYAALSLALHARRRGEERGSTR
jgi:phosphatidylcholine synthase